MILKQVPMRNQGKTNVNSEDELKEKDITAYRKTEVVSYTKEDQMVDSKCKASPWTEVLEKMSVMMGKKHQWKNMVMNLRCLMSRIMKKMRNKTHNWQFPKRVRRRLTSKIILLKDPQVICRHAMRQTRIVP